MADLETAAAEAVVNVQPLLQQLAEAEKECENAGGHLQAIATQLVADRKDLLEAVEALAQEADALGTRLGEQASDAVAALVALTAALRQAGTEGAEDLDAEKTGVDSAGTLVSELGPRVTEAAEAAEKASHAALEMATAVAQTLDESIREVVQLVGVDLPFLAVDVEGRIAPPVGGTP